jgi:hypothetical protein
MACRERRRQHVGDRHQLPWQDVARRTAEFENGAVSSATELVRGKIWSADGQIEELDRRVRQPLRQAVSIA